MEEAWEDGTLGPDMAMKERGGWEDGTLGPDMAMEAREDGTLGPGPRIMEAGALNPENLEATGVTSIMIHVTASLAQGTKGRRRRREESQSGTQNAIDPGSKEA